MAIQTYEEGTPSEEQAKASDTIKSNPAKRLRWATQRAKASDGKRKRQSIMNRLHMRSGSNDKKRDSALTDSDGSNPDSIEAEKGDSQKSDKRTIYFNLPLPDSARDEEGHPLAHFSRNKIRTAKYTPLSFIPKNLYFQFHNIANVYFAFIVILSIFPIFGASNPGLSSVPIIVILTITAIKDAIEDFRRTVLDNELNNSPVHRLVDWNNVNTAEDQVSLWRKFKKANTRVIVSFWSLLMRRPSKPKDNGEWNDYAERAIDASRQSITPSRPSGLDQRLSFYSTRSQPLADEIQLGPVASPRPEHDQLEGTGFSSDNKPAGESGARHASNDQAANRASVQPPARFYGSLIDPYREIDGKARFKKDYWKNVQVGDFIRLYNGDEIPADIVVLSTSDPDGACYVETKNLDGETNLKVRQALRCGRKVKRARDCEKTEFYIDSEPPQPNLYAYSGVARWQQRDPKDHDAPATEMAESISINNILLRGCSVRNTEWILGVVLYTGDDSKIMLNSGATPRKRAKISRDLNWNVIYNFIILFCMCMVAAFVEGTTWGKGNESLDFFEFGSYGSTASLNGFITFWAAVVLFQNLVPISLYISLEIIRTFQAFFIFSDTYMYYDKVDYPCTPKSWNISDDLGQIEYIFSDKTGTLTQNVMEFKKATINSVPYGEAYTEAQAGMQKRKGIDVEEEGRQARERIAKDKATMIKDLRQIHDNPYLRNEELTFVAPDFVGDLRGDSGEEQKQANERFMLALALCHTVITERTPGEPPTIEFKAQSPDEAALVATARDCGFTVIGRSNDGINLNVMGDDRSYEVLNTLEFNSSRKRMSAVVRMPDGKIILFCKGADSIIYSRLKRGEQPELRKTTAEHLEMFAREGLRTLCIAQRELDEEEYQTWNAEHDLAAAAVENREEKLEEVSDAIERELTLLGGTAIEDRLQDGVPDAIALLGNAGIKLWVLTGDKVETAINIGFSCNLLNNDMDLIIFSVEDESLNTAEAELDKHLATFGMKGSDEELKAARNDHRAPDPTHAIVIDGDSLKLVLSDNLKQKFLLLCKQCKAVLCCRVSPAQKADVVRMVKIGLDVITLSIGDGANDVAMIQEADVGVGIAGEEGRQAVMSSDFAIGQFRFLARLTLVHGRWCYRRLAEMIANFFYKNVVWTFALFWYQIFDNFDCSYVFDYSYILAYNLAFTSLPVIFQGVLDQDVSDKVSLAVPQLYIRGIERKEWTQTKFWLYMADGLYQSAVCFFMVYLLFQPATFNTDSGLQVNDSRRMGVYIANATVVVVNVYILLNTYRWDWAMISVTIFSVSLIWLWTGIYTAFTNGFTFYKSAPQVYGQLSFWAETFLTIIVCLLPRFMAKAYQKIYMPLDVDIIREQVHQGKFDYLQNEDPSMLIPVKKPSISDSSEGRSKGRAASTQPEDERPMYPPSISQSGTTYNYHSQNGSDETNRPTTHKSFDPPQIPLERPKLSIEKPTRPSFERMRSSMDKTRPSFEASRDFTSAALLSRVESSQSGVSHLSPVRTRPGFEAATSSPLRSRTDLHETQ